MRLGFSGCGPLFIYGWIVGMQQDDILSRQLAYFAEYFQNINCKKKSQPRPYYREGEQHLIANYDEASADHFKGWHLHHRLGLTLDGDPALSKSDLIRMGMYYNRPYFELIYLRNSVHSSLHCSKRHSERKFWVMLCGI